MSNRNIPPKYGVSSGPDIVAFHTYGSSSFNCIDIPGAGFI